MKLLQNKMKINLPYVFDSRAIFTKEPTVYLSN